MVRESAANDAEEEVTIERPDGSSVDLVRPRIRITASDMTDEKGAAAYLGKSVRTLQRYRQQKCGPAYHDIHGTIWYSVADLKEYIALWRVDPLAS